YGHAKQALFEALEARLGAPRERYEALLSRPEELEDILQDGAVRAQHLARNTMQRVREACGFLPTLRATR
ncbi:MAG TPA: tryptophan--tRNA ligase, partial [Myxococcota bacterium]|nr:tryptophan--tRNA ligase [Myxococcota bacterium]